VCQRQDFLSLITITGLQNCHAENSLG